MMSALQKRSVLILGAAAVAMAIVFIAVYDWTGDENTSPQQIAMRDTGGAAPSLPVTVDFDVPTAYTPPESAATADTPTQRRASP